MEKRELNQRERLLHEAAGCCIYCGRPLTPETMEVDHILPRSKGGSNDYSNKVCACPHCNSRKADMDLRAFLAGFSGRKRRAYGNRLEALAEQGRLCESKRRLLEDVRPPQSGLPGSIGLYRICLYGPFRL